MMLFLWRVLLLPMNSIYKIVMVYRILEIFELDFMHKNTPVCKMLQTCSRYGLLETVIHAVQNGQYICMNQWKVWVRKVVFDNSKKTCKIASYMFQSMSLLSKCSFENGIIGWWYYAHYAPQDFKMCSTIVRLLLNSYRINGKICNVCYEGIYDVSHILFVCKEIEERRSLLWNRVLASCPPRLAYELTQMNHKSRAQLILAAPPGGAAASMVYT